MSDEIEAAVIRAIEAHGGTLEEKLDGDRLRVRAGGQFFSLYLDNLRRRVQMGDSLDAAVAEFVNPVINPMPDIEIALRRGGLRLMLEQAAVLEGTGALVRPLSTEVSISLVWTDPAEARIRFIQPNVLHGWELPEEDAWRAAGENMDRLLGDAPIKVLDAKDLQLGMLETNSIFKASLITAPSLQQHVVAKVGWPILAVTPCRDFAYLIPENARDKLGRMGAVVEREFKQSAYPLSPEVFQISDAGIRSIGRFQIGTT